MRGDDRKQDDMFSYISPEQRIPQDHPLRGIRGTPPAHSHRGGESSDNVEGMTSEEL